MGDGDDRLKHTTGVKGVHTRYSNEVAYKRVNIRALISVDKNTTQFIKDSLKNNGITLDVYELDDVLESTSWTGI